MRWKSRLTAFMLCFAIGLVAAFIAAGVLSLRNQRHAKHQSQTTISPCQTTDSFSQPEAVLAALKSAEVNVRSQMFKRLLLRPDIITVYYDYERDLNYPERVDRARLQYVQLDDSPEAEALLTFVRFEHPIALVFKKGPCGWQLLAALSSWLRFEDYPYQNWLSLPETIKPGVHELLVRDSTGDSASYLRKARLLRLDPDALTQVADIEEEAVEAISDYHGADWSDVKRRRINHCNFLHEHAGQPARIECEITEEVIRLNGAAPHYSYWLETDGSWHARQRNWTGRPTTRVKLLSVSKEEFVWREQEGQFIKL